MSVASMTCHSRVMSPGLGLYVRTEELPSFVVAREDPLSPRVVKPRLLTNTARLGVRVCIWNPWRDPDAAGGATDKSTGRRSRRSKPGKQARHTTGFRDVSQARSARS